MMNEHACEAMAQSQTKNVFQSGEPLLQMSAILNILGFLAHCQSLRSPQRNQSLREKAARNGQVVDHGISPPSSSNLDSSQA